MSQLASIGMISNPIYGKIQNSNQTTNQNISESDDLIEINDWKLISDFNRCFILFYDDSKLIYAKIHYMVYQCLSRFMVDLAYLWLTGFVDQLLSWGKYLGWLELGLKQLDDHGWLGGIAMKKTTANTGVSHQWGMPNSSMV